MQVSYQNDEGMWEKNEFNEGDVCLMCGGVVEKNTWKKPDNKQPDLRCNNKDCTPKGRRGYWIVKPKQPAHILKLTQTNTGTQILLSKILEELKKIAENTKPVFNE